MAPTFGSAGTFLSAGTSGTANIAVPSGVTAGSVVVAFVFVASNGAVTPPAGQGWAEVTPFPSTSGTGFVSSLHVFWKRATGNDSTPYSFTFSSVRRAGVAVRFEGCVASGNPFDTGAGVPDSSTSGGVNSTTTPTVTLETQGPNRLLVWAGSTISDSSWTMPTTGGTWAGRVNTGSAIAVATLAQSAAGSTGNISGRTSASTRKTAWLLALLGAPEQTVAVASSIEAPPAPGEPTLVPVVSPSPILAPPPPGEPVVIPGPVDVVVAASIPAPPAPGNPNVQRTIHVTQSIPPPAPPGVPVLEQSVRPPLRVDFWALDDDGSVLCPLPHVVSWDISLIPGENGAVQIEYPRDGLNYEVLNSRITKKRDLRIRIRWDGTHARSMGALLHARDGDEIAEGGTVRFLGAFLPILLGEAPLPFNGASEDGSWTFTDGTAGSILIDALNTVKADGYLADTVWSFTDQFDSNGVEWSMETSAVFSPGKSILELVQQLRAWGMCEFEVVDSVTGGLEVRAYEPSTVGNDFTLSDPPIVFRAGRDLLEAPRKTDVSDAATSLLIAGDEGVYVEVDDPSAIAQRGRKVGRFLSEGNLTTAGAAEAYGILELSRSVEGVDELTHALTFAQDQPVPIRELMPMDWVYTDTGTGLQRNRIAQVTISQAAGDDTYTGGITLGDLIAGRDVIVQRQLDGLVGGQIITGTSTTGPDTDDGKAPAQVQGVAVISAAYPDQDQTRAAVSTTWIEVTDNFDGSPATDIQQYEIQYRYAGGEEGLPTDWIAVAPQTDLDASWDGVVAGVAIAVRVRAVDRYGHAGEWSAEELHTTEADNNPPPVPSTPTVSNYIGLIRVDWDGLGSAGEQQPPDFDRVEILASETNDFDPATDPYTVIGMLRGESAYPWSPPGSLGNADYGITWYVKLRSVDKTGNTSAVSGQGSAVPGQVAEGDIASVNIGQLTAGIMNALMIVGRKIATGTTGSRVEIDGDQGLFCINSDDEVVFSYDIDDEILQMIGRFIAGSPDGNGAKIVLDPDFLQPGNPGPFPSLLAYSDNGLQGPARINATDQPTSGPGHTALGLNSGPTDDDATYEQTTMFLWPTQAYLSVNAGGGGVEESDRRGGAMVLSKNGAGIEYSPNGVTRSFFAADANGSTIIGRNTSGVERSSVVANADGSVSIIAATDVGIYGPNGTKLELNSDGSVRLGGSNNGYIDIVGGQVKVMNGGIQKTFIIDHPLDPDRWLIHACAEGPVAELLYSGEATIRNGRAIVELPSYFEAAAKTEGRQVQLTPVDELCMVAASRIVDGRFIIKCSGDDGTVVQWRVIATRADVEQFPVEPLKSEIDVRGDGPYRYIAGMRTRD